MYVDRKLRWEIVPKTGNPQMLRMNNSFKLIRLCNEVIAKTF